MRRGAQDATCRWYCTALHRPDRVEPAELRRRVVQRQHAREAHRMIRPKELIVHINRNLHHATYNIQHTTQTAGCNTAMQRPGASYAQCAACRVLLAARLTLFASCCVLHAQRYTAAAGCILHAAGCVCYIARRMLHLACCMLHAVRFTLHGAHMTVLRHREVPHVHVQRQLVVLREPLQYQ